MALDGCLDILGEKSASMTAVESSGSSTMHSEMVRRGGAGGWITATGSYRSQSRPPRRRARAPGTRRSRWQLPLPRCDHMVSHSAIIALFLPVRSPAAGDPIPLRGRQFAAKGSHDQDSATLTHVDSTRLRDFWENPLMRFFAPGP